MLTVRNNVNRARTTGDEGLDEILMGGGAMTGREIVPFGEALRSLTGTLRAHTSLREVRFSLPRMCLDGTTSHGSSISTLVKNEDDMIGWRCYDEKGDRPLQGGFALPYGEAPRPHLAARGSR